MSIEGRETDAYAAKRRAENEAMARARLSAAPQVATEADRRYLVRLVQDAAETVSAVVLRDVARRMGALPPSYSQSEDAGQPWTPSSGCGPECSMCNPDDRPIPGAWPGQDSGAEGGL